jgi:lipopolysaccharide export system permease protein
MAVTARYALRELFGVLCIVSLVLLLIGLGGRFIGYLQDAALGKYSAEIVLTLLGFRLPEFVQLILPFSLFLAVLLTFSRWYAESEMTVLVAAGAAPAKILRWVMGFALVIASGVAVLSLVVTPSFSLALDQALIDQRENREFEALTPGVFHSLYRGRRVTYTESMDSQRRNLRNVFIGERLETGVRITTWAEAGSQFEDPLTGSRFLVLDRGRRYEGIPGEGGYRVLDFARLSQRVEKPQIERREAKLKTVATAALLDNPAAAAKAELHWRLALPLLTLIAPLLAFGQCRVKPREGRFAHLLPALGLFLLYYVALVLLRQALSDARLPSAVGLWPVHAGFALLAWLLFHRSQLPARC